MVVRKCHPPIGHRAKLQAHLATALQGAGARYTADAKHHPEKSHRPDRRAVAGRNTRIQCRNPGQARREIRKLLEQLRRSNSRGQADRPTKPTPNHLTRSPGGAGQSEMAGRHGLVEIRLIDFPITLWRAPLRPRSSRTFGGCRCSLRFRRDSRMQTHRPRMQADPDIQLDLPQRSDTHRKRNLPL